MEFIKISGIIIVCIVTVSFIPMVDKAVSSIISICICFVVLTYVLDMITPAIAEGYKEALEASEKRISKYTSQVK